AQDDRASGRSRVRGHRGDAASPGGAGGGTGGTGDRRLAHDGAGRHELYGYLHRLHARQHGGCRPFDRDQPTADGCHTGGSARRRGRLHARDQFAPPHAGPLHRRRDPRRGDPRHDPVQRDLPPGHGHARRDPHGSVATTGCADGDAYLPPTRRDGDGDSRPDAGDAGDRWGKSCPTGVCRSGTHSFGARGREPGRCDRGTSAHPAL
ncbi:MAG: hypothetical protein AVDCRST_MAG88-3377, partial [uncultured Thermomicrobiales bacterium]